MAPSACARDAGRQRDRGGEDRGHAHDRAPVAAQQRARQRAPANAPPRTVARQEPRAVPRVHRRLRRLVMGRDQRLRQGLWGHFDGDLAPADRTCPWDLGGEGCAEAPGYE